MKYLFISLLLLILSSAEAQNFSCLFIPDSLKKGADVVKRYEEYVVEIKDPGKARIYERHVYSILNNNAGHWAKYKTYYDNFTNINSVSGVLYDFLGKEVKHLKKKDWQDMSVYDGISLANDDRVKVNEFFYNNYPFTVDYEEEDEKDGIMSITSWFPVSDYGMSVEYSKYTIIAPASYEIRYKAFNYSTSPVITEKDGKKVYTWELKNIKAYKEEEGAPNLFEIAPNIQIAPSDLEVEGYKGNMSTWINFGKFINQLVAGKDQLPAEIKTKVHDITDHLSSEKEKVFALYDFMQKNTHYISIQLGIGGWQPFDASFVADKKYGDCKALSNYMVALLKEAGVKAKYVLIRSGEDAPSLMEDFSCNQFNHAVSCVPMGKDTIWLECTSQTESPGFMGSFTGNRRAVIIDEDGGHIVSTPRYTTKENVKSSVINAVISNEGLLDATIKTQYSGIEQELPHALMNEASRDYREKYLNKMLKLPSYEVLSNDYSQQKGILPVVNEDLHIKATGYASITGRRLFINPNIFSGSSEKLIPDSSRKYDYIVNRCFTHIDSVVIIIPDGYKPESVPREIDLDTKFGKYQCSVKINGNQVIYFRRNIQNKGRYSPSEYNELVKFFDQIYKADRAKVVLVKQE
ncbi:MAG: DUF3857 domain-containing protein [Sphingobacteriales bacterium]|nr:MAG: DUF3857 domain-containing protein [Sphingobacteriales bacterium]